MLVAKVALPRPNVDTTFDYIVPADLAPAAKRGLRALVPLGGSLITGYITELAEAAGARKALKPIEELIDEEPLLSPEILALTRWVADYYLVAWGDVLKAALPAGINVEERRMLRLTAEGRIEHDRLHRLALVSPEEGRARDLLDRLRTAVKMRAARLQKQFKTSLLSRLLARGWLEEVTTRTGAALEKTRKAVVAVADPAAPAEGFWKRSPKRRPALERLRESSTPVPMTEIEEKLGAGSSVISSLVDAGVAEYVRLPVRRDPFRTIEVERTPPHDLDGDQRSVWSEVAAAVGSGRLSTFLLHGVTGSGKTEVYLHAARDCLRAGKSALVLIPELALTPQFVRRYYSVFGGDLAVLHSALSGGERIDEWMRIRRGEAKVVLGTRLSIFAPLEGIGLIVVDEEHDGSFKQEDYPYFSARDLAVVRAELNGAVCLLGSATPSLDSLENVRRGKYRLLELRRRVFDRPLPELHQVDLRLPENRDAKGGLPPIVRQAVSEALSRREQTLVLVGRKGYAPFVLCRACGHSFECRACSITMSFHKELRKLKCHYCGALVELPSYCPACGSPSLDKVGTGSEKVEEQFRAAYPSAEIARMDRDAVTNPRAYAELLGRLRLREIDILIGTQMIAKGHDYPFVTKVIAMGLDSLLRLPDFRHAERVFQLIQQIAGRAGRGEIRGDVYILTYRPDHYAVKAACESDWEGFLDRERRYRARLFYPPFSRLALITVEDFDRARGARLADAWARSLERETAGWAYVLGPSLAPYARLKNRWRHQVLVKSTDRRRLVDTLRSVRDGMRQTGNTRIRIDPVSVM